MGQSLVRFLSSEDIKAELPVYLMMLCYIFVFSFATVIKFYSLKTSAYDLGNYNQALYTTLRGYGFLYYTADLPANPGGSMMGVHFSPVLLIILPIYALYPAPQNLLVLQSFVLALGVLPINWLAKYLLKTRFWGMFFSAIYLLNPMLQGINWFDFHPEAFFATFFLFFLYYGLKGEWLKYILFSILTLTTIEYAAILILVNSFYLLWTHKKEIKPSLHAWKVQGFRSINAHLKYPLITIILAILWFFVALQVISVFSPENPMVKGGAPQWSILGAEGIFDVPLQVIMSPQRAFEALTYEWPLKLIYLLILFSSTAFLSFLSPRSLILTLPWLGVALLSNYSPFYYTGTQYPAFLLPPMIVGSIIGTKRFLERAPEKRVPFNAQKKLGLFLLILSLIFSILVGPLYGFHLGSWPALVHLHAYGLPQVTEHDKIVMQVLSLIPQNASIITQNNIFPLLSSRTNSFVIPLGSFYPPGTDFNTTLNQWLEQSDFVLVDSKTSLLEPYLIYTYIKNFEVYVSADGVILLKHNYLGNPVLFVPYEALFNWDELTLISGKTIPDSTSDSQRVLLHRASLDPVTDFWCGPYVCLPPGKYKATFKLKATNSSNPHIATISVSGFPLELHVEKLGTEDTGYNLLFATDFSNSTVVNSSRILSGDDFSEPNVYKEFGLSFSVNIPTVFEFRGTNVSGDTDVYLDWIRVIQLSALP